MHNPKTSKLNITELDFDLVKASLKSYLQAQDEFTDYDFDGSGMSVLLDLLAYNTHYNAFYTNMIANEMFLDSATLRDSVVSIAKQLGYTPRSVVGAKAIVGLSFVPNDLGGFDAGIQTDSTRLGSVVNIPKGMVFTSEFDSKTYSFVTTKSYSANPVANTSGGYLVSSSSTSSVVGYVADNVEIFQGVYSNIQYVYNSGIKQQFIIPNEGVDTDTITVLVTDTITGTAKTVYNKADDYVSITGSSKVFFLQESFDGLYEIYFGDNVIGEKPADGNVIEITYVVSEGDAGNGASVFKPDPIKSPYYGINGSTKTYNPTITLVQRALAGSPRESINSIKYLAPRNFESQNRAVTTNDYVVNLLTNYPNLDAVHAWGGEDNDPPQYGKVFISIKPSVGYVLTQTEKENIKRNILKTRNMLTVDPIIVDPETLFLVLTSTIKWDSRLTSLTESTLRFGIRNSIVQFGQNILEKFATYFRYSALLGAIDDIDSGVINNELSVKLRLEVQPKLSIGTNYIVNFSNRLFHPHADHSGAISSTTFTYDGFVACTLQDLNGIIQIIGSKTSGESILVSGNIGTIDYLTGKLLLNSFAPTSVSGGGTLSIFATPVNQDVIPGNNQLISIRDSDVKINMLNDASGGTLTSGGVN